MNKMYDVVIIGGGPAGLAAAKSAKENGAESILVIERDRELGGILQQCIHNGFGLHHFKEELTGPGYANRVIDMVADKEGIETLIDTMVLSVDKDKNVTVMGPNLGLQTVKAKAIVFTMGCRERTRGAIRIPGARPAGVFTAGAAQRMVNMEGYLPGKKVVILGSGDIGLIMARRMTLEGAKVLAVLELMPMSNGLTRNIVQCLDDYGIPLYLSHTIVGIHGVDRVTGVTCAKVDDNMQAIAGTEFDLECDCVLLSVGLIPEIELLRGLGLAMDGKTTGPIVDNRRQTSQPGFFAAGNVVHVHDLVDFVSEEGNIAGHYAALYAQGESFKENEKLVEVNPGDGIRSVVPQKIADVGSKEDNCRLFMRVTQPHDKCKVVIKAKDGSVIKEKNLLVAKPSEMIEFDIKTGELLASGGVATVNLVV